MFPNNTKEVNHVWHPEYTLKINFPHLKKEVPAWASKMLSKSVKKPTTKL